MSLAHKDRISELDSLKALALVMMLISNFVSDLSFFKIMEVTKGDPWWYLARATASLFVCISGFSYYLANRESPNFTRVFLRKKKLINWAIIITIETYLFQPSAYIRFGVLHLLALASLVAFPFVKKPITSFLFGLLLFLLPLSSEPMLVWIGLRETGFFAVDYFPLNPWLGLFFLSMASARFIYPDGKALSNIEWPEKWIWLGRNTLLIYVFHQPFLIAIMLLTGIISFDQVLD